MAWIFTIGPPFLPFFSLAGAPILARLAVSHAAVHGGCWWSQEDHDLQVPPMTGEDLFGSEKDNRFFLAETNWDGEGGLYDKHVQWWTGYLCIYIILYNICIHIFIYLWINDLCFGAWKPKWPWSALHLVGQQLQKKGVIHIPSMYLFIYDIST